MTTAATLYPTISPRFIQSAAANLRFWQTQMATPYAATSADYENLLRAVDMGLRLPQTQVAAGQLVQDAFWLLLRQQRWTTWLPLLEQAIAVSRTAAPPLTVRLINRLGQLWRLQYRFETAVACHQQALALANTLADAHLQAAVQYNLAEDYLAQRDYSQAADAAIAALTYFADRQPGSKWHATTLRTRGTIAHARGSYDEARRDLTASLALWQALDDQTETINTLSMLAVNADRAEWFDDASDYYQQAKTTLTTFDADNMQMQTMLAINRGTLMYRLEQWAQAEAVFRSVLTPALRQSSNVPYQALLNNNLGNVIYEQGRYEEALVFLDRAIALWQLLGEALSEGNSRGSRAGVWAAQGRAVEAAAEYRRAIDLLAQYPQDAWATRLTGKFADKLAALDDSDSN